MQLVAQHNAHNVALTIVWLAAHDRKAVVCTPGQRVYNEAYLRNGATQRHLKEQYAGQQLRHAACEDSFCLARVCQCVSTLQKICSVGV